MQKRQAEEIIQSFVGMTYAEWKQIAQYIDLEFIKVRNQLTLTVGMAEDAAQRLFTERDQMFR